ncbi:MAG: hypothetical protein P4L56_02025 [Candidatus Sulfopaludibacter sp.]|nr:hypothetical protein [Candidatus Sulfopaludibacter sp.]
MAAEDPDVGTGLQVARKRYELALAELRRAEGVYTDLGGSHPDGTEVLRNANREFSIAAEQFRNALQKFSDAVLRKTRGDSIPGRIADKSNR